MKAYECARCGEHLGAHYLSWAPLSVGMFCGVDCLPKYGDYPALEIHARNVRAVRYYLDAATHWRALGEVTWGEQLSTIDRLLRDCEKAEQAWIKAQRVRMRQWAAARSGDGGEVQS